MALTKITGEGVGAIDSLTVDTNTLVVDATNNKVGIDNSSPAQLLSVGGTSSGTKIIQVTNSTAGTAFNNGMQMFINDDSGGLNMRENYPLKFFVNGSERMRISGNGDVQLGTTTNHGDNNQGGVTFQASTFDRMMVNIGHTDGSSRPVVRFFGNASESSSGNISCNGSSTAYNTSSDHRLKENVSDMTGAIDRVKALAPKRFNFIADADTTVDGFLAHEAQAIVPEAVTGSHNEVDEDDNAVMQSIDQSKLVPLLTGALKEAVAKIEALEARVKTLEDA